MDVLSRLNELLITFRPFFTSQGYALFCAFIMGFMFHPGRKTVTGIYQGSRPKSRYWSLVKFLSRGRWDADAVAQKVIQMLQQVFKNWVYVYDETHAVKSGKSQFGLHFFRNHKYQKRNRNQSKFHWGHQFAALGLLCLSASQAILFPVWVKMVLPGDVAHNSLAVLQTILSQIPVGLIIFDRGYNNRKVFKILLGCGHHLLCRAKSNAVFYYLPKPWEQPKRGRKRKYGKRVYIPKMRFRNMKVDGETVSAVDAIVHTKMCPQKVRLVVKRTKPKKSKPYRYFMVYTTDLELPVETILHYYRLRWEIETAFRDTKQNFGFDEYQVKSQLSISRFVQLSFVSASITQLLFAHPLSPALDAEQICDSLGMHWYQPSKLTRGLMQAYLRYLALHHLFSTAKVMFINSQKNQIDLMKAA
jgi:IS4 transposase